MIIEKVIVGPIQTNCYIIGDEQSGQGAVIDPGGDAEVVLQTIGELNLKTLYVINTHAHFDHIAANRALLEATGAKLVVHPGDAPFLTQGGGAPLFGLPVVASPPADIFVEEGDILNVGDTQLQVLHTPGHSPGGIALYCAAAGVVFSGDLLFHSGVGRTDLPGADHNALLRSLEKVLALPEETTVYPGHGPETTVGYEKDNNPFLPR